MSRLNFVEEGDEDRVEATKTGSPMKQEHGWYLQFSLNRHSLIQDICFYCDIFGIDKPFLWDLKEAQAQSIVLPKQAISIYHFNHEQTGNSQEYF